MLFALLHCCLPILPVFRSSCATFETRGRPIYLYARPESEISEKILELLYPPCTSVHVSFVSDRSLWGYLLLGDIIKT